MPMPPDVILFLIKGGSFLFTRNDNFYFILVTLPSKGDFITFLYFQFTQLVIPLKNKDWFIKKRFVLCANIKKL